MSTVKAWKEKVIIPTYEIGEPEKYPIFLEKRVYQGSSGEVYPNPVIEHIEDIKTDKEWEVIFIENDYLKIMVIPALGGRIQMAYDKIRERHFVYYNHVIKPALVGLTGPWISGGIEFNWPQHHRPSTYSATDFYMEDNADGSSTVWVSELERMFRTKGMAGFTLYPDKAYLEIKVQLYNPTPHPQTFLWWANPAVAVNDHYQSVFPPDVNAVFDHGKRDVSEFPIAKGEYYKFNYSPGTDISKYSTIPVPTSYMAITSDYDFVGGYENDTKGGLLHIADHNISPGKKQWTWGNGDFGRAWDRNLTDGDGPYIELMCGVYTDNQPDFSWMHPYEEKRFKQYFMPYYNVGMVKNATKEALVNLEVANDQAFIKIHVTSKYKNCTILLKGDGKIILKEYQDLSPENGYEQSMVLEGMYNVLSINLKDSKGKTLVFWELRENPKREVPEAAKAARTPKEMDSLEQLYLTGFHLEQYRHATYDPTAYYLEALNREPKNILCNNAMGLWFLKKGKFDNALSHFNTAISTLTERNPNPYNGEPYFNKGQTLLFLGDRDGAYKAFFKACWNAAWQDAGYFNLSRLDSMNENYEKALELLDKALVRNCHNHKGRHLKIALLRKLGKTLEAKKLIIDSLAVDKFNFGAIYEDYLLNNRSGKPVLLINRIRNNVHNYIELSLDYSQAGLYEEAINVLKISIKEKTKTYPMVYYFMGWYYSQIKDASKTMECYAKAHKMPMDYCFPSRLEEVVVLKSAIDFNPEDDRAYYYLGNFWYANRQYKDAQSCWETANGLNGNNPICNRNLALLYYNKIDRKTLAKEHLEKAFYLDNNNSRVLMELDQLYKKQNVSVDKRLELLESHMELTISRDDLYLERVSLYNFKGLYKQALDLVQNRVFHPWEGGEGKVPFQYITANVELAKVCISQKKYQEALTYLEAAQKYPHNLGEGKLEGAQENDIYYWVGCVYEKLNDINRAVEHWKKASQGLDHPEQAIFYNDQQPDKIFYQGMALLKLNRLEEAKQRFVNLITYGQQHWKDEAKLDYFAVSLPDLLIWEEDLKERNKSHCSYLIGLGHLGMGALELAQEAFAQVTKNELYHLSAQLHKKMAKTVHRQ